MTTVRFDAEQEKRLLADWFGTVQFDKPSKGLPPLADEDDDEHGLRTDAITKAAKGPVAAGLAVRAKDTGRVLMLQRALPDDKDEDPAAGTWELPGGRLDDDELPWDAACREWEEETGCKLPKGQRTGEWTSNNGVYQGYVWTVKNENKVPIFGDRDHTPNPDDPDGDKTEALAWWDPQHLQDNPAVRQELADSLDKLMPLLPAGTIEKGHPYPGQHYRHGWIPVGPEEQGPWKDSVMPIGELHAIAMQNNLDPGSEKVRELAEDIKQNGIREPLQVEMTRTGPFLGDGHHRLLAASLAGLEHLPVRIYENSPEGRRAANRAMLGKGLTKCLTCGCDMPHNEHDDHRHITIEDLQAAADAAGITVEEAAANLQHALRHEQRIDKGRLPSGTRDWQAHPWSHGWVWHGPTTVGTKIDHKSFGEGKVVGATKTRIKVEFPDGKTRTFPHAAGVAAAGKPTELHAPAAPRAPRRAESKKTSGRHRAAAPAASTSAPTPKRKTAKGLLEDAHRYGAKKPIPLDSDLGRELHAVFGGTHAGLTTKVSSAKITDTGVLEVDIAIHGADGQRIGRAVRQIGVDANGDAYARHELLKIGEDVRGQGFAQTFNRHLEDWYRQSGVKRIELQADIDVGGYAWARAGYTWRDGKVPEPVRNRLLEAMIPTSSKDYNVDFGKDGSYEVTGPGGKTLGNFDFYDDAHTAIRTHMLDSLPDTPEMRRAKALLARIDAGEYVSPYEISELGRPANAGRDDRWLGKLALLGSDWEGVKWL